MFHSDCRFTWVVGGRSGVKNIRRRVKGPEGETDSCRKKMNDASTESGIERDAQQEEQGKRVETSWRGG